MATGNEIPVARFTLPDDWSPVGVVCAIVPCPDDPQYLETLAGIIRTLADSASHERDDTKTGARSVALTWRKALLTAPIRFGECEATLFELRDDPLDPCSVEQSIDGGITWTHAFSKEDCDGPVVVVPPLPGNPEAAAAAAGNLIRNVFIGLLDMIGDCTITRAEFIDTATAYLRLGDPAYSNPIALGNLYDTWCALDPADQEDALDECTYATKHLELTDCYNAEGIIEDLNCLSETVQQWLDETSEELGINLNSVAAALGFPGWQSFSNGSFTGGAGGAGGGGGFGSECGWCAEFDLTADDWQTGNPTNITQYAGTYSAGVGYVSTGGTQIDIRFEFAGIYLITYMEIEYDTTGGDHNDGEGFRLNTQHGTFAGGPFNPYVSANENETEAHRIHRAALHILSAGHSPIGTGYVQVQTYAGIVSPGVQTITRWKICGTGANPFT